MNSTTEELLKEYDEWKTRRAFASPQNSPADFMQERRIQRLVDALSQYLTDDNDDRYPLAEYLLEEDIDWLKSQRDAPLTVV